MVVGMVVGIAVEMVLLGVVGKVLMIRNVWCSEGEKKLLCD